MKGTLKKGIISEEEPQKLGTYKNVILTNDEFNKFKNQYPENYENVINRLSSFLQAGIYKTDRPYYKLQDLASRTNA